MTLTWLLDTFAKYGATGVFLVFTVILWLRLEKVHRDAQTKYESLLAETIKTLAVIQKALDEDKA